MDTERVLAPRRRKKDRAVSTIPRKWASVESSLSGKTQDVAELLRRYKQSILDIDHVSRLLIGEVPAESLAAVNFGTAWNLVVLLDRRISSRGPARYVATVDHHGEVNVAKWTELRGLPAWRVTPDTKFSGSVWRQWSDSGDPPPLDFDANTWKGTYEGYVWEGTWKVESEDVWTFSLEEAVLKFDGPAQLKRGEWLELTCGGATGTGGDIGYTLTVEDGSVWVYQWGYQTHFLGRMDPATFDPLAEILGCMDGGDLSGVVYVSSEVLGVKALRDILKRLATVDVNFDAHRIQVSGRGFERSADKLLS